MDQEKPLKFRFFFIAPQKGFIVHFCFDVGVQMHSGL